MMQKRRLRPIHGLMLLSLLVAGCMEQRVALKVKDDPIKVEKAEGLIATVRYLDDPTLIQKYGKEGNPFLTDYYRLQIKRLMVFELSVENETNEPADFRLNRLELQFGGKALESYNRFQLMQHWEFQDQRVKTIALDKVRRESIINQWVLPNKLTIPPVGKIKGYVVFIGNTPRYGKANLYVPLFKPKSEDIIYRFEFAFEF
jgi:hypothetical protein